jgi:hypothetical protein
MIERDEYDLWAESSEETIRKESQAKALTMLANLDRWMEDAFNFIDSEMQTMEGMDNE